MDPKLACEWQVEICFLASGRLELLAPVPDRGVLNIWDFGRQINRGSWKCARVRVCTKGYKPTLLFLLSKEPVYQHTLANFPVGNIYSQCRHHVSDEKQPQFSVLFNSCHFQPTISRLPRGCQVDPILHIHPLKPTSRNV